MKRILIVEDNAFFRQFLKETMGLRFPSIETFEAANGEEAMREIEANQPAAVFVDLRLAGENGLDLTKKIKAKYPDLVVVILTNYDLPEYREAAYRSGADHFISKDSFLSMVNSILTDQNIRRTNPNRSGPGEKPTMAHGLGSSRSDRTVREDGKNE